MIAFKNQTDSKKLRRLFVLSALLPTVIALTIASLFLWQIQTIKKMSQQENQAHRIISEANLVYRLILDSQTNFRGYKITDDKNYFIRFRQIDEIIPQKVKYLESLVLKNLDQKNILDEILDDYLDWQNNVNKFIKTKKEATLSTTERGNIIMTKVKVGFNKFISFEENQLLEKSGNFREKTNLLIIFGVSLSLLLGVVLSFFTRNSILHITKTLTSATSKAESMSKDLGKALSARDEFLSIASHELKTPLTSLKLRLDMTLRSIDPENSIAYNPLKFRKNIILCNLQVQRMSNLIDQLLDISKIQLGLLSLNIEKVNISDLTREALSFYRDQFKEAGCVLTTSIEENIHINCDPFRLDQVLVNLLSNALKYGAGSPISILLKREGTKVIFKISDSGIGIEHDMQSSIFNRFERAQNSRVISGLGLGLYIAKQIVNAHRGEISVDSEPGRGSTFTVVLPTYKEAMINEVTVNA